MPTAAEVAERVGRARAHLKTPKTNSEVRARSEVIVHLDDEIRRLERLVYAAEAQRRTLRDELEHTVHSYYGWAHPDGYLIPTEPDPDERARIRMRLAVKIDTLMMVLGMSREEREPWQKAAGA